MPTVPRYQDTQQHVALRPEYTEGLSVRADAEAFGAGVGRGMQVLARGLETASDAMVRVLELDDANSAKDAGTRYADWQRNALYGENGFLKLSGKTALDARAAFERQAGQKRMEFARGLTPGAAKLYDHSSREAMTGLLDSAISHVAEQRKAWFTETSNRRIAGYASDALATYNDPAKVDAAIEGGLTELDEQGYMHGWSADVLAERKQHYVSGVTKDIVVDIAGRDALAADDYMAERRGQLSDADRKELETALAGPVLQARANRNLSEITGSLSIPTYDDGRPAGPRRDLVAGSASPDAGPGPGPTRARAALLPQDYRTFAASAITGPQNAPFGRLPALPRGPSGMMNGDTETAVTGFLKNAAGTTVDPSVGLWSRDVLNDVLDRQGVTPGHNREPRSYLHFGTATDAPRPGDIVVFNRDNDMADVGLFQGHDANGRILVLGSNHARAGRIEVTAEDPARLLGIRTAGTVDPDTMKLANYSPRGLSEIERKLAAITDPDERAATRNVLDAHFTAQERAIDAARDDAQQWAQAQVKSDPAFDPMTMPVKTQSTIGPSGMRALRDYHRTVRQSGEPNTDESTLSELQNQYANDPQGFAKADLFQHRSRLSDQDWEKVTAWRQVAQTDRKRAKSESFDLNRTFTRSRELMTELGFIRYPSNMTAEEARRLAQLQIGLAEDVTEFKRLNNGKTLTETDMQKMLNDRLIPMIASRAPITGERS